MTESSSSFEQLLNQSTPYALTSEDETRERLRTGPHPPAGQGPPDSGRLCTGLRVRANIPVPPWRGLRGPSGTAQHPPLKPIERRYENR